MDPPGPGLPAAAPAATPLAGPRPHPERDGPAAGPAAAPAAGADPRAALEAVRIEVGKAVVGQDAV